MYRFHVRSRPPVLAYGIHNADLPPSLYGLILQQAYYYFRTFPGDHWLLKSTVSPSCTTFRAPHWMIADDDGLHVGVAPTVRVPRHRSYVRAS